MARLKLTEQERANLLKGIDAAQRRVSEWDGDMTEADAKAILRDTLGDTLNDILKAHKSERRLT